MNENPLSNIVWEDKLTWFKSSSFEHNWLWANGIWVEYFSGSTTLQLCNRVQQFLSKMSEKPEEFTGRIVFMSMFNDISWWSKENKQECESCAQLVSIYAKRFSSGRWSFLGHGSEKKWYSTLECKPQGEGDRIAELMMLKFGEGKHPVFRSTSPLSRGVLKSKGGGKLSIHFCADGDTIETVFHTIISVNQVSIYGAVSDVCEEYSTCQTSMVRPVLAEQSDPLFAPANFLIMTPRPSIEILTQENVMQKYKERVERLPQPDHLIKTCTDAGFLKTVEVGQYFMTKHTDEFLQFTEPVTCREYTLPRDEKSTDTKGWIRGNTKIGPVLDVTTSYLQGKYEVALRIESVTKDNFHSRVRSSHGLNKLVTDLIDKEYDDNEQETSESKTEVFALASRSKAKAKARRPSIPLLPHLQELNLFVKEYGLILTRSSIRSSVPSGKKTKHSSSARRITSRRRWGDRILETERWSSGGSLSTLNIGLMICRRARWQEAEATSKGFNIVLTRQDKNFFTFELFKVIQNAIPLILHCRTMC